MRCRDNIVQKQRPYFHSLLDLFFLIAVTVALSLTHVLALVVSHLLCRSLARNAYPWLIALYSTNAFTTAATQVSRRRRENWRGTNRSPQAYRRSGQQPLPRRTIPPPPPTRSPARPSPPPRRNNPCRPAATHGRTRSATVLQPTLPTTIGPFRPLLPGVVNFYPFPLYFFRG